MIWTEKTKVNVAISGDQVAGPALP